MPNFDGTGPRGRGAMTGRGLGYCVISDQMDNGIQGYQGFAGLPVHTPGQPFTLFNQMPRPVFRHPYHQWYGSGFRNAIRSQAVLRRYGNRW